MQKAEVHVQLKPGIFGVKVRIMPPDAKFPDKIEILDDHPTEDQTTEEMSVQEPATEGEKAEETEEEGKGENQEEAG
jgi:small subunit ribosomal protein S3